MLRAIRAEMQADEYLYLSETGECEYESMDNLRRALTAQGRADAALRDHDLFMEAACSVIH